MTERETLENWKETRLEELRTKPVSQIRKEMRELQDDPDCSKEDREEAERDLSIEDDGTFRRIVLEKAEIRLNRWIESLKKGTFFSG